MKIIRISIFFVLTFVMLSGQALAETLNIVTLDLPPYGYVEKGVRMGLNYDLGNELARAAGLEPENRIVPLARGIEDISSGRADIIIMFPNPEINSYGVNLGEVLPMETVIVGRAGTVLRTLRDVRGKTLATVRGAKYDDRVSKKSGIILYPTDSYEQSLKMLLAGRVDAVIGPNLGLYSTARKMNVPKQALCEPLVLSVAQGCVFVSKLTPAATVEKLKKAIDLIKKEKINEKLLTKYAL